ncbi:hypothetical protein [Georgenia ruanii]|uniref:Uncharacterized protein n=1 Tax=Georgenia ruanii TaxID=348442 RepID=A0A7J9UTX3_9MICO|nr:hypothetical protein [Georgenia ruanii]MPV87204.1 hypothetical protein [Georgenia ruanii]
MSDHATAPSAATTTYRCEHCDDSVPHEHLDVTAIVTAAGRAAVVHAGWMLALALVLAVAAVAVAVADAGLGAALGALVPVVVGWLVVTAAGLGVVGAVRARSSDARALVAGGLTGAALTPLAALAVALLAGPGWPAALVAGGGWLLCGAVAALVRARAVRLLLVAPGAAGERERVRAIASRGRDDWGQQARWLLQGVALAVATWLLGLVPAAVAVLVPLSVVAAVAAARRGLRD